MKLLSQRPVLPLIAAAHSFFYIATGVWPLVHMPSFVAITGAESKPERAWWLVQTVGALVVAIGVVIGIVAVLRRFTLETVLFAIAAPIALTAVDLVLVPKGIIGPVYLIDALGETILCILWIWGWRRDRHLSAS